MHYIVIDLEWNQPLSHQSSAFRRVGDRLEIIRGEQTSDETLWRALADALRTGAAEIAPGSSRKKVTRSRC